MNMKRSLSLPVTGDTYRIYDDSVGLPDNLNHYSQIYEYYVRSLTDLENIWVMALHWIKLKREAIPRTESVFHATEGNTVPSY